MRLPGSDLLFGIPVVMDTNDEALQPGMKVELTYQGQSLAVLDIDSKWTPNKAVEALNCYGTSSLEHPGVLMIATERGKYYIGGKVSILHASHSLPQMRCQQPAQNRSKHSRYMPQVNDSNACPSPPPPLFTSIPGS